MQSSDALNATLLIVSIGVVVSGCEHLALLKEFSVGGIYTPLLHVDSKIFRATANTPAGDNLYSQKLLASCLGVQLILASLIISFSVSRTVQFHPFLLWLLVVTCASVSWRRKVGGDGANQMTMVVLTASAINFTFQHNGDCCRAAAIFIAAQACLSYLVAGVAKTMSALWRSGRALENILDTNTFGSMWMSGLLKKSRFLSLCLNWCVIVGELFFSLVIFAPKPIRVGMLCVGVGFHLVNAVVMGLNDFVWAFVGTYPCIYWAATQIMSHA